MSEPPGTPSLEELITNRITNSALGVADASDPTKYGVYVNNPVASIPKPQTGSVGRVPLTGMKKTATLDAAPSWDLLRPDPLPPDKATVLGEQGTKPAAERVKYYLDWGSTRAREHPFVGVCESFNCVVIAMLMANKSPLPAGEVIEYIGIKHGAVGHAICVIRRANAMQAVGAKVDAAIDTWGDGCIIVDQWYGLQAVCTPVFHVSGAQANAAYVNWVKGGSPVFTVCGRFTVGTPKRPEIKPGRSERPF